MIFARPKVRRPTRRFGSTWLPPRTETHLERRSLAAPFFLRGAGFAGLYALASDEFLNQALQGTSNNDNLRPNVNLTAANHAADDPAGFFPPDQAGDGFESVQSETAVQDGGNPARGGGSVPAILAEVNFQHMFNVATPATTPNFTLFPSVSEANSGDSNTQGALGTGLTYNFVNADQSPNTSTKVLAGTFDIAFAPPRLGTTASPSNFGLADNPAVNVNVYAPDFAAPYYGGLNVLTVTTPGSDLRIDYLTSAGGVTTTNTRIIPGFFATGGSTSPQTSVM